MFAENFWPQSEPPQAMAFNPRGRVSKALTPPPTTQSINNQVSDHAQLGGRRGDLKLPAYWEVHLKRSRRRRCATVALSSLCGDASAEKCERWGSETLLWPIRAKKLQRRPPLPKTPPSFIALLP